MFIIARFEGAKEKVLFSLPKFGRACSENGRAVCSIEWKKLEMKNEKGEDGSVRKYRAENV